MTQVTFVYGQKVYRPPAFLPAEARVVASALSGLRTEDKACQRAKLTTRCILWAIAGAAIALAFFA